MIKHLQECPAGVSVCLICPRGTRCPSSCQWRSGTKSRPLLNGLNLRIKSDKLLLQGNSGSLRGDGPDLERLSDELRELEKTLSQLLKDEERSGGYWTSLVKKINRIFFICYVTTAGVFLAVIFYKWIETDSISDWCLGLCMCVEGSSVLNPKVQTLQECRHHPCWTGVREEVRPRGGPEGFPRTAPARTAPQEQLILNSSTSKLYTPALSGDNSITANQDRHFSFCTLLLYSCSADRLQAQTNLCTFLSRECKVVGSLTCIVSVHWAWNVHTYCSCTV